MLRAGLFTDIPRVRELLETMHARSRYAGRCKVDGGRVRDILMAAVGGARKPGEGAACLFVWESEAPPPAVGRQVDGFIIGTLNRVYLIGDKLVAQDMFFVTDQAEPRAAGELIDAYVAWAIERPKVIEVNLSATDVVQPTERVERLFSRKGFKKTGVIYRKDIA